jgi:murein L,D-transpeptidase YafK
MKFKKTSTKIYRYIIVFYLFIECCKSYANLKVSSFLPILFVDKSNLIVELKIGGNSFLGKRRIATGKGRGDKSKKGDNNTPEGIYFLGDKIPLKKFHYEKYGVLARPINYPNEYDIFKKKTGYGIWLHGIGDRERIKSKYTTEGCIAFYNEDIKDINSWLPADQSIVIIANDMSKINTISDIDKVKESFSIWLEAWRQRDIKNYMDMYSSYFKLGGKNKIQYSKYKNKIFSSYREITINAKDLHIITHNNYAVSIINQDFYGDKHYISKGRKILYWLRSSEGWKIIREVFADNYIKSFDLKLSSNSNVIK